MSLEAPVKYDVDDPHSWVNEIGNWKSLGLNLHGYKVAVNEGQRILEELRFSKASGSPAFFINFNAEAAGIKFKSDGWDALSAGTFMIYPQPGLATPEEYKAFLDGGKQIIEYVAQIDRNVKTLFAKLDSYPQDDFFASTNNPYVDLLWALLRNGDLIFIPNLVETYRNAVEGLLIRGVAFPFDSANDLETSIHLQFFQSAADKMMENPDIFGDNAFFAPAIAVILKAYVSEKGGNPDIIRVKDGIQAQVAPVVAVEEAPAVEGEGEVTVDEAQAPAAPEVPEAPAVEGEGEDPVDEAQDLVDPIPVAPEAPHVPEGVAGEVPLTGGWVDWASHHCSIV